MLLKTEVTGSRRAGDETQKKWEPRGVGGPKFRDCPSPTANLVLRTLDSNGGGSDHGYASVPRWKEVGSSTGTGIRGARQPPRLGTGTASSSWSCGRRTAATSQDLH